MFSRIWRDVEVVRRWKEGKEASLEMEEEGRPRPREGEEEEEEGREEEAAEAMKRGVMIVGATGAYTSPPPGRKKRKR